MRSIELFSGAGGLALGTARAGFEHAAVVERDPDCCETLRTNQRRGIARVKDWNVVEADVKLFDYSNVGPVDFIAGGVPCQPFSLGGKHRAHEDARDMFPEFARAVAELRPRAFLVENVKGLLRTSFADYLEYIKLRLSHPLVPRGDRDWRDHRMELERIHTAGASTGLEYNVVCELLNAADYGVPQRRERVFIVGFRAALGVRWAFPKPTPSRHSLLRDQLETGAYWERHRIAAKAREALIARVPPRPKTLGGEDGLAPWRTVRDAIGDIQHVRIGHTDPSDPNHYLNPGARSYKGHTGSPWDEPAKTLKAGDHGVPGGENTLDLGDGSARYFSPREAARIQTFPDDFLITGSWTEQMRQMGNAVPVNLARVVADDVARCLSDR